MSDLLVIVPSRGRPENVARLLTAFDDTGATCDLVVAIDDDDPEWRRYYDVRGERGKGAPYRGVSSQRRMGLGGTLNAWAVFASELGYPRIAFMGDDHLPRTPGWDRRMVAELDDLGTGIAYADDLFQGENLPTAVFMTSDIVRALGYMAPPCLRHMYLDNFWLDLGTALGRIRYVPDVVIEHLHPHAGKAEVDPGYERVWPLMEADRVAYETYKHDQFAADVAKVRALVPA